MAISPTVIDSGVGTNADPSVTANNITPTANAPILVGVALTSSTTITVDGLSGCGITWTEVASDLSDINFYVFRGSNAAPTLGKLSFNLSASATVQYVIVEVAGADNSTTDGVVQSAIGDGTTDTLTATLGAFASASNGVVAITRATVSVASDIVPGTGYTELSDDSFGSHHLGVQWRADNDTSVDETTANTTTATIIAMEIAVSSTFVPRTISY